MTTTEAERERRRHYDMLYHAQAAGQKWARTGALWEFAGDIAITLGEGRDPAALWRRIGGEPYRERDYVVEFLRAAMATT